MALKIKNDWVAKYEELLQSFPNLNSEELLPKKTADYYYRAVAFLHEASTVHSNFAASSLSEVRMKPTAAFRLQYITPCLAVSEGDLKEDKREELFTSDKWVFTHKRNGVRGWWLKFGQFTSVYSRNYSSEDGRLLAYEDHLAPMLGNVFNFEGDFAVDVEIEMAADVDIQVVEELGLPTSPLEMIVGLLGMLPHTCQRVLTDYYSRTGRHLINFNLITPLVWKDTNFINRRIGDAFDVRSGVLSELKPILPELFDIDMCSGSKEEKVEFLERLLASGAEGVVAHNLDGFYSTGVNRRKDVYVKLKRSVSATNMKGETVDGWISGYALGTKGTKNENRITSIEVSINLFDNNTQVWSIHKIAQVAGLTDKVVKELSDYSAATPVLKAEAYNRVVEIDGMGISHVNWRLTHPRFLRFREDKSIEECQMTTEFIESCVNRAAFHTRL